LKTKTQTSPDEDKFLAQAAKDYYQAAKAVDGYQTAVLRTLREVTEQFESDLVKLGLPFAKAREIRKLADYPSIEPRITLPHLQAGLKLEWYDPDDAETIQPLCAYWWVWLEGSSRRQRLDSFFSETTNKPFEWAPTGCICLYFPSSQSARIKENTRKCTEEFLRVMKGSRSLLRPPEEPSKAKRAAPREQKIKRKQSATR
jgi:hypothetical protein